MQQKFQCPYCFAVVNYGQKFCICCGAPINWQGISSSSPFQNSYRAASGETRSRFGASGTMPAGQGSEQWKQDMQRKSRLWQEKLAHDPSYAQSPWNYKKARTRPGTLLVTLIVLVMVLAGIAVTGIATHGNYFGLFPSSDLLTESPSQTATIPPDQPSVTAPDQAPPPISAVSPELNSESGSSQNEIPGAGIQMPGEAPVLNVPELEQQIHALINQQRIAGGLPGLSWDDKLNAIARSHSEDMADRNYFNHTTPEGLSVADRYRQAGYAMVTGCGENIFMCPEVKADYYSNGQLVGSEYYQQDEMAGVVVNGWMNSEGHRQNILNPNWKTEAIGIAISSDGKVYITEDFA